MSKAQRDFRELWYQQRGPLTVAVPLNSMHVITAETLDFSVPQGWMFAL